MGRGRMKKTKKKCAGGGGTGLLPITCIFCDKVLANFNCMIMHINSHIGERPYSCDYCDATFVSISVLKVHMDNIHLGIRHKCTGCGTVFKCRSNWYGHRAKSGCKGRSCVVIKGGKKVPKVKKKLVIKRGRSVGGGAKKRKRDPDCEMEVVKEIKKSEEEKVTTPPVPVPVICSGDRKEGDDGLSSKEVKEDVIVRTVGTGRRRKNQKRKLNVVKKKKKTKVQGRGLPATCIFCDKVFLSYHFLTIHTNTHTEERPFLCDYCDATFASLATRKAHMDNIHLEIKHKCTGCGRVFNATSNLCNHRTKTGCRGKGGGVLIQGGKMISKIKKVVKRSKKDSDNNEGELEMEIIGKGEEEKVFEHSVQNEKSRMPRFNEDMDDGFVFDISKMHLVLEEKRREMEAMQPNWNPNFFFHMNRYNPEDSPFSSSPKITSLPPDSYSNIFKKPKLVKKKKRKPEETSDKSPHDDLIPEKRGRLTDQTDQKSVLESERGSDLVELHKCDLCNKLYSNRSNLTQHLKIHSEVRDFQCFFCPALFRFKSNTVKHIAALHQNPDGDPKIVTDRVRPRCGLCGERFSGGLDELYRHLMSYHKKKMDLLKISERKQLVERTIKGEDSSCSTGGGQGPLVAPQEVGEQKTETV